MKEKKFTSFMKKYGYYCLAGLLTVAIALTVAFSLDTNEQKPKENEEVPTQTQTVTFGFPLNNFTILKDYSADNLQYNATMNQWEAHKAIDLYSESALVYAVLDGVVESVETTYENGTTIKVSHADGLTSVYSSLAENVKVATGDRVVKGQEIASISDSASLEANDGEHLHFEILKDGQKVDPSNYISFSNK